MRRIFMAALAAGACTSSGGSPPAGRPGDAAASFNPADTIIGNHEFNYGLGHLNRAIAQATFPFLAANVYAVIRDLLIEEVRGAGVLRPEDYHQRNWRIAPDSLVGAAYRSMRRLPYDRPRAP